MQYETGQTIIDKCNDANRRMNAGIDLIENNDKVYQAFVFMNQAMYLQRSITAFSKDYGNGIPCSLIAKRNADIMGSNTDPFYGAPVILIVLGKKDWPTHVYDGSLVMGNLMLAAHDLGIGSCWIHRAKEEFESDWGKKLLKSLGIEDEYEGIGHCALGYVDGDYPDVIPRKENRVFYI